MFCHDKKQHNGFCKRNLQFFEKYFNTKERTKAPGLL